MTSHVSEKTSPAKARPYECGVSEPFDPATRWPVRFALDFDFADEL